MKTLNSILIFTVLIAAIGYAVSFSGCSDTLTSSTGTAPKTYQARTEKDFVKDHNLKAEPGAVIVVNLEDLHGKLDPEEFDTDLIGVDIIPYTYTETAEHKISIGDSSYFAISLINENTKQVIYELTPTNNHTTVTIPAGDYLLVITSLEEFGSDSLGSQTVFIQPDMETGLNRGGGQGQVDYNPTQLNQLLRTRYCPRCDLSGANLSGANLVGLLCPGCDLSGANLRGANLLGSSLAYANLKNADLRRANLLASSLDHALLNSADLRGANLFKASFYKARLDSARLDSAYLHRAYLKEANLFKANLSYANLDHAFLKEAKLSDANLSYANLYKVDLEKADLWKANLSDANLSYANLYKVDLRGTNLSNAILSYADLRNASFCGANKTGIIAFGVTTNSFTNCWP